MQAKRKAKSPQLVNSPKIYSDSMRSSAYQPGQRDVLIFHLQLNLSLNIMDREGGKACWDLECGLTLNFEVINGCFKTTEWYCGTLKDPGGQ